jgi:hypothetical protein
VIGSTARAAGTGHWADLPMYGDAVFGGLPGAHGPHRYRYVLWRCWDPSAAQLTFVLCNPSTAGGLENGTLRSDPTVDRLIEIALRDGAGGFVLVNLVAWIDPALNSLDRADLDGDENERYLSRAIQLSHKLVVGWGSRPQLQARGECIIRASSDRVRWCVGMNNASKTPMHPLQRGPKRLGLEHYLCHQVDVTDA